MVSAYLVDYKVTITRQDEAIYMLSLTIYHYTCKILYIEQYEQSGDRITQE
jgi:hypothetical protein